MRGLVIPFERRRPSEAPDAPPRRFLPLRGHLLTLANIRGPWRPSGSVAGVGVFAVVWETWRGSFWPPLHDFSAPDVLRLVEACRRLEHEAGLPGASQDWRRCCPASAPSSRTSSATRACSRPSVKPGCRCASPSLACFLWPTARGASGGGRGN